MHVLVLSICFVNSTFINWYNGGGYIKLTRKMERRFAACISIMYLFCECYIFGNWMQWWYHIKLTWKTERRIILWIASIWIMIHGWQRTSTATRSIGKLHLHRGFFSSGNFNSIMWIFNSGNFNSNKSIMWIFNLGNSNYTKRIFNLG